MCRFVYILQQEIKGLKNIQNLSWTVLVFPNTDNRKKFDTSSLYCYFDKFNIHDS